MLIGAVVWHHLALRRDQLGCSWSSRSTAQGSSHTRCQTSQRARRTSNRGTEAGPCRCARSLQQEAYSYYREAAFADSLAPVLIAMQVVSYGIIITWAAFVGLSSYGAHRAVLATQVGNGRVVVLNEDPDNTLVTVNVTACELGGIVPEADYVVQVVARDKHGRSAVRCGNAGSRLLPAVFVMRWFGGPA